MQCSVIRPSCPRPLLPRQACRSGSRDPASPGVARIILGAGHTSAAGVLRPGPAGGRASVVACQVPRRRGLPGKAAGFQRLTRAPLPEFLRNKREKFVGRFGPGELHALRQRGLEPVQLGRRYQRPATETAEDLQGRDARWNLSVYRQAAISRGGAARRATGKHAWTRSRMGFADGETSMVPESMFTATETSRWLVIDTISLRIMCGRCLTTSRIPTPKRAASHFHNNWPLPPSRRGLKIRRGSQPPSLAQCRSAPLRVAAARIPSILIFGSDFLAIDSGGAGKASEG